MIGALAFDEPRPELPHRALALDGPCSLPPQVATASAPQPASASDLQTPDVAAPPTEAASAHPTTAASTPPHDEIFRHPECPVGWGVVVVPLFPNRDDDADFMAASRAYRATGHFGDDVMAGIYNEQLVTCRRFMDDEHHGIDFRFWTGSVMWEPVWRAVMFVARQPWVAEAYVGVTACCRWRWADC